MSVRGLIQQLVKECETKLPIFALCGSFVSNFYRREKQAWPRFDILTRKEFVSRVHDVELMRSEAIGIRVQLWPDEFPWAENALRRAQIFQVDFGFGRTPVLTCEDIIIGYLHELKMEQSAALALGDLQDIFLANPKLDLSYLVSEMKRFELSFPPLMRELIPPAVYRISRRNDKATGMEWGKALATPRSYYARSTWDYNCAAQKYFRSLERAAEDYRNSPMLGKFPELKAKAE